MMNYKGVSLTLEPEEPTTRGADTSVLPELIPYIQEASEKTGLEPNLIKAVIEHESSGGRNIRATGSSAYGPMQIIYGTAKELGINRYDPRENIIGGAQYLKQQIDTFGDVEKGLAAYFKGPGKVSEYGLNIPGTEGGRTVDSYYNDILRRKQKLDQQSKNKYQGLSIELEPEEEVVQKPATDVPVATPTMAEEPAMTPEVQAMFGGGRSRGGGASGSFGEDVAQPEGVLPESPYMNIQTEEPSTTGVSLTDEPTITGKEALGIVGKGVATGLVAAGEQVPGVKTIQKITGGRETAQQMAKESPASAAVGGFLGNVALVIGGASLSTKKLAATAISPMWQAVIRRAGTQAALATGQNVESVAIGEKDLRQGIEDVVVRTGASLASLIPETALPSDGVRILAQLPAQVGTDVVYDALVALKRGQKLDTDWVLQSLPSWGMSAGFALLDIKSGDSFRATQRAIRNDAKGTVKRAREFLKAHPDAKKTFHFIGPDGKLAAEISPERLAEIDAMVKQDIDRSVAPIKPVEPGDISDVETRELPGGKVGVHKESPGLIGAENIRRAEAGLEPTPTGGIGKSIPEGELTKPIKDDIFEVGGKGVDRGLSDIQKARQAGEPAEVAAPGDAPRVSGDIDAEPVVSRVAGEGAGKGVEAPPEKPTQLDPPQVVLWDLKTGELIQVFPKSAGARSHAAGLNVLSPEQKSDVAQNKVGMAFIDDDGSWRIQTDDAKSEMAKQAVAESIVPTEYKGVSLELEPEGRAADPPKQTSFPDSAVKTEVYHGTASGEFESFDPYGTNYGLMGAGSYFTESKNLAGQYTEKGVKRMARKGKPPSKQVFTVHLDIKNPIDMEAAADVAKWQNTWAAKEYGVDFSGTKTNEDAYRKLESALEGTENLPVYEGAEIMQDALRSMGYDGATHIGGGRVKGDSEKHRVWIAFDPEQVKVVTKEPVTGKASTYKGASLTLEPEGVDVDIHVSNDGPLAPVKGVGEAGERLARADEMAAKAQAELAEMSQRGAVTIPEAPIKATNEAMEAVFGHFRAFGRQYVSDKPLASRFEQAFHERVAGVEKGISDVDKAMKAAGDRSLNNSLKVVFALEETGISKQDLPADAHKLYDVSKKVIDDLTALEQKTGTLGEGFPEGTRNNINEQISKIETKGKLTNADVKKIGELREDLASLEKFQGYLPHSVVARRVMQSIYENGNSRQKRDMAQRLEQFHRQRKGRATLREYIENGVISAEDADIGKLLMTMAVSTNQKVAMKSLVDYGQKNNYIVTAEESPNKKDWFDLSQLATSAQVYKMAAPKGEKVWVHRLFGLGLEELSGANRIGTNVFDKALSISKVGQFYKPNIIWAYNMQQRIYGGAVELNPAKDARNTIDAWRSVLSQDETYQEASRLGIFQAPDNIPRSSIDKQIDVISRKTRSDIARGGKLVNRFKKVLEQATGEKMEYQAWKDKEVNALVDGLMLPIRATANATWAGDKVQRLHTYLNLTRKGMEPKLAAEQTAKMHGAYSKIGRDYKNWASRLFFVHSFRMLMPIQTVRSYWDPVKLSLDKMAGKPIPRGEAGRVAGALAGTILFPTLIDSALRSWGWENTEEEKELFEKTPLRFLRVPIGDTKYKVTLALPNWKYKKTFNYRGEDREVVVGINNIVNMATKWIVRGQPRPQAANAGLKELPIYSLLKWEINPLYRTAIDIFENESSFGDPPPRGAAGDDWGNAAGYLFGSTLRLYGDAMRLATGEPESNVYKKRQRAELERALSFGERVMTNVFGYAYTRAEKGKRGAFMLQQLNRNIESAKRNAEKYFEGERLDEEVGYLEGEKIKRTLKILKQYPNPDLSPSQKIKIKRSIIEYNRAQKKEQP